MLTVGKPLDRMPMSELSRVRPGPFLCRLAIYLVLVAGLATAIVVTHGMIAVVAMLCLGLVYAHGVELQHQALHNTALPSKGWNRFLGFFLGLPMLVSFSDYQYSHLRHHRLLGTGDDREFFNYGYDRLTSLKPLLAHLLMLSHYRDVTGFIARALLGKTKPEVRRENALKIRAEYQWTALFLAAAVAVSIAFRTPILVYLWLVPLLTAIPAHALIELPEHWGQNHGTLDVASNTRTVAAGGFGCWYTNGNNYHIEHHWLPGVPNDRFPELHRLIADQIASETYPIFYRRFFLELYRNTFYANRGAGGAVA
jgi:fatty acid desaturase